MNKLFEDYSQGVSIVVPLPSLDNMDNIFRNYMQQLITKKELIIVVNNELDCIDYWVEKANAYPMVRIYQQNESNTLGECLNYGISHAIFTHIAIFSDIHYYGPYYLSNAFNTYYSSNTAILGKSTYFSLDLILNKQIVVYGGNENSFTDYVILPTLFFKKEIAEILPFCKSNTEIGIQFCEECRSKNLSIYSGDRYNFIYYIN